MEGLLPGTLTVVAGATGVGKTQLGLHWANAGPERRRAARRPLRLDQSRRFSESRRLRLRAVRLDLSEYPLTSEPRFRACWDFSATIGDYFHPFDAAGRRVTQADLEADQWHEWKSDLSRVPRDVGRLFLSAVRPRIAPGRL